MIKHVNVKFISSQHNFPAYPIFVIKRFRVKVHFSNCFLKLVM